MVNKMNMSSGLENSMGYFIYRPNDNLNIHEENTYENPLL